MHIKRTLAVGILLSIAGLASQAHAVGVKIYTNTAHRYSLQYPANWIVKTSTGHTDAKFVAPDNNALVISSATPGKATPAQVKAQQAKVLKGLGTPQGPVTFKIAPIHGVNYAISEIVTKTPQGKLFDAVLLDTVHGPYLYDFDAFILFHAASTKAETAMVQGIFNSIQLH